VTRPFADEPVWVPVHNVLICDARPGIRQALTRMARHIHTAANVDYVADECALLAAYAAKPADLVLIGLPPGAPDGTEATNRLLTQHPLANVIVYGSPRDTALLTAAVASGAHGFLLWTADHGRNHPRPPVHRHHTTRPNPTGHRCPAAAHRNLARPTHRTRTAGPARNQPRTDQPGNRS